MKYLKNIKTQDMKKHLYRYILPVLVILLYSTSIKSQTIQCGTILDNTQIDYENSLPDITSDLIELNQSLHIHVYIVKKDSDGTEFNSVQVADAISVTDDALKKIGVNLILVDTTIIDNYQLNNIREGRSDENLTAQYNQKNVINLYLVDYLFTSDNKAVCGYTYYPSAGIDNIFIRKSCFSTSFFIEQFGHLLNLYHTHETAFGSELADKSNCETAGDLCCDTPADPDLSKVSIDADCSYSGSQKDGNGNYYAPTTSNYMSYSTEECRCTFTNDQLKRIVQCLQGTKSHLY